MYTANNELTQKQSDEIHQALKEADAGDFASNEEVQAVVTNWKFLKDKLNAKDK